MLGCSTWFFVGFFYWFPSGFLGFSKTVSMVFHRFPSWSAPPGFAFCVIFGHFGPFLRAFLEFLLLFFLGFLSKSKFIWSILSGGTLELNSPFGLS